MSREHFEEMLDYYQQELIYLHSAGSRFAKEYPKLAQSLNMSSFGSSDPHVQRLLESFAFLTGRLQKEVDNRYIQFTNTLLGVLYPQFVSPSPSSSIASFRLSPHLGKSTSGYVVPKGTPLYIEAQEKKTCRFQTTYPVELWPFEIAAADIFNIDDTPITSSLLQTQWILRLRIERYDGSIGELNPTSLRFFITGNSLSAQMIYDSLFAYLPNTPTPVFLMSDTAEHPSQLPPSSLKPVGFEPEDALIPYPDKTLDAYRLLHEYFVFPEKFQFFDIQNFSTQGAKNYVDIFIPLADRTRADKLRITKKSFLLGCSPIINLFPKISEPINLNYQSISYPLIGDQRNDDTTEIHTILKVVASIGGGADTEVFAPYFSYDYETEDRNNGLFWHSTRTPSDDPDISGTDVSLSFVDYNFTPQKPSSQTVYAYTLCTNRDLATYVTAGSSLQVEGDLPPTKITCLDRPTAPISPSLSGESLWKLVSQLSLNHLSLSGGSKAVSVLKELLHLYSGFNKNKSHPEINTLMDLSYTSVVRRMGDESWKGFVQGLSISLTIDEVPFAGHGGFMLASVLNVFFRLYASINSFTELTLISTQTDGVWKQWPAQIGSQHLV